jgi:D-alanyl-D-alanine carboxypeptidase
MVKLAHFFVAAWILSSLPATAQPLSSRLDAATAPYFKSDSPGATVIVTSDGKTVFRKAYGMARLEPRLALDAGMSLRLGSLTKQFTATAILMLAEQGELSLADDIRKFLPHFPDKGNTITIAHLLTHTSGIANYTDDPGYIFNMAKDMTVEQVIATFKDVPATFAPGERFAYSNSGYFLLGAIIEKVSGKRYADFLAQQIFEPLGMRHTAYEGVERHKNVQAQGYSGSDGKFVPHAPLSMTQPFAAGSLVSTVDDLARWNAAIADGKLLRKESWQQAFTPYVLTNGATTGYGYGWGIGTLNGSTAIGHGGGINGFSSFALHLPNENVYVAVLANSESGVPEIVANMAAAIVIGRPFPDFKERPVKPAVPVGLAPGVFERYVGKYELAPGFIIEIKLVAGKYIAQASREGPQEIFPLSDVLFYSRTVDAQLRFEPDPDGVVRQLVFVQGGREIPGRRQ